jgi:serine/threonine-protein kinase
MKVLLPGLVASEELAERFLREIKVLAALNHPNIAALRTALSAEGQVVMVMELVEGESLSKRLSRGPLAVTEALACIDQVLAALGYAHAQGVVHRDVKPANMMVTDDGLVKLTDFGIARSARDSALTATGTTAGSLSYMSPEQVNGGQVDARSDLYSAGISLYEMVTGRPPFKATSEFVLMSAHVTEPPRPPLELRPDLPEALNGIILRAMAKDPAERFQDANEFREALASVAAAESEVVAGTLLSPGHARIPEAPVPTDRQPLPPSSPLAAGAQRPSTPAHVAPSPGREGAAHRLLYVIAGAVLVIVAAAGTGAYLRRAEAGSDRTTAPAKVPQPAPADGGSVPAAPPTADPPSAAEPPATSPAPVGGIDAFAPAVTPGKIAPSEPARPTSTSTSPRRPTSASPASGTAATPDATAPATQALPAPQAGTARPAPEPDDFARLDQQIDQLVIRAASVNDSLDRLQEGQARQGFGLRSDMAARQRSMNLNVSRAEEAIGQRDASKASAYLSRALADLEALEKFLGR